MRRFCLTREDESSPTGNVVMLAEGVMFRSGKVVLSYLPRGKSMNAVIQYDNINDARKDVTANGKANLVWIDSDHARPEASDVAVDSWEAAVARVPAQFRIKVKAAQENRVPGDSEHKCYPRRTRYRRGSR